MAAETPTWIWQQPDWPDVRYDARALATDLAALAQAIGRLQGRIATLRAPDRDRAALSALLSDVVQSSAIEGEALDVDAVRSSLARRLGVDEVKRARADRHVDAIVEMNLDATRNADAPLTVTRLQAWQSALFPTGRSGMTESASAAGATTRMVRCRWYQGRSAGIAFTSRHRPPTASMRKSHDSRRGAKRRRPNRHCCAPVSRTCES